MSKTRTAGELAFIDQETRRLTVAWARRAVPNKDNSFQYPDPVGDRVYIDHAISKKWISRQTDSKDGGVATFKLLSAGWKTAAAFLKR